MSQQLLDVIAKHKRSRRVRRHHRFVTSFKDTNRVVLDIPVLEADQTAPTPLTELLKRKGVSLHLYGYGYLLGCFESCLVNEDGSAQVAWSISNEDIESIRLRLGNQPLAVTLEARIDNPLKNTSTGWTFTRAYITTQAAIDVERTIPIERDNYQNQNA